MFCLYITHGEAPESCSVALALLPSNSALPTSPSPLTSDQESSPSPTSPSTNSVAHQDSSPSLRRLTKLLHHEPTQEPPKLKKEKRNGAFSIESGRPTTRCEPQKSPKMKWYIPFCATESVWSPNEWNTGQKIIGESAIKKTNLFLIDSWQNIYKRLGKIILILFYTKHPPTYICAGSLCNLMILSEFNNGFPRTHCSADFQAQTFEFC